MVRIRKYSLNFVPPRASNSTHGWIVVLGVSLVFVSVVFLWADQTFSYKFS